MASLSGGMLLQLVAFELDGAGSCKLDALAESAYVSQLCWLPPPPYSWPVFSSYPLFICLDFTAQASRG